MKPGITVGSRVLVANELKHKHPVAISAPQQPGSEGVVASIYPGIYPGGRTFSRTFSVQHDDGSEPWYHIEDLTLLPSQEVARTAGELTPEQRRLDALEAEVKELRAIFTDWQERVGSQLDQIADAAIDELAADPAAADRGAAIAAAQPWCELPLDTKNHVFEWLGSLGTADSWLEPCKAALEAVPVLSLPKSPWERRKEELIDALHLAADQWWDAFDSAEPDPVDGPDDTRAKQEELACAEENLHDALAALRDAGIHPSP